MSPHYSHTTFSCTVTLTLTIAVTHTHAHTLLCSYLDPWKRYAELGAHFNNVVGPARHSTHLCVVATSHTTRPPTPPPARYLMCDINTRNKDVKPMQKHVVDVSNTTKWTCKLVHTFHMETSTNTRMGVLTHNLKRLPMDYPPYVSHHHWASIPTLHAFTKYSVNDDGSNDVVERSWSMQSLVWYSVMKCSVVLVVNSRYCHSQHVCRVGFPFQCHYVGLKLMWYNQIPKTWTITELRSVCAVGLTRWKKGITFCTHVINEDVVLVRGSRKH